MTQFYLDFYRQRFGSSINFLYYQPPNPIYPSLHVHANNMSCVRAKLVEGESEVSSSKKVWINISIKWIEAWIETHEVEISMNGCWCAAKIDWHSNKRNQFEYSLIWMTNNAIDKQWIAQKKIKEPPKSWNKKTHPANGKPRNATQTKMDIATCYFSMAHTLCNHIANVSKQDRVCATICAENRLNVEFKSWMHCKYCESCSIV